MNNKFEQKRYKIIIVEDDNELRENMEEFLRKNYFEVIGVGSAAEFYKAVEMDVYDLAILDIGLPDRNDFELSKNLRENSQTRIIILTAKASFEDKLEGYYSGADAYFVKPVNSWELKACITSILGRHKHDNTAINEWVFNPSYLVLTSPAGKSINLTTKEGVFLNLLIKNKSDNVSRIDLFNELNKAEGLNYDNSALDILVARLRKRVKEKLGEQLPVRTVRSVGYCFFAYVRIDE